MNVVYVGNAMLNIGRGFSHTKENFQQLNWMVLKIQFFHYFHTLTQTIVISEIIHYLMLQPHDRIKPWNYVFEFKCSENNRYL